MRRSKTREEKTCQSQTQEKRELLFGEEEQEEQVHQDAQGNDEEVEKEVDPDAKIIDGDNNEEVSTEAERVKESRVEKDTRSPYPTR